MRHYLLSIPLIIFEENSVSKMLSYRTQRALNIIAQRWIVERRTSYKFSNLVDSKIDDQKQLNDNQKHENARSYAEIPGMSKLAFFCAFLPGGPCFGGTINDLTGYMHRKFGDIFRMPGIFGNPESIVCLNPDDYPIIMRNEGKWPHRKAFDTIIYYREVYRRDFFDGFEGIISTNGEKWAKARTAVNPILMQPKNAILYLNVLVEISDDFLQRIREIRDPVSKEMPDNFINDINRLTFESVAAVALNTKLGIIRKNEETEETQMIGSMQRVMDLAFQLDILPSVWKLISTPMFREQMRILDNMTNVCNKHITTALNQIEHDADGKLTTQMGKERSVMEKLLRIDKRLAVVMALDMMLAGVDTTSTSLVGILLCLAKHPDKQEKLLKEILRMLPEKNSSPTMENMQNLPYLRACIKEGLRLYPILPGTMRKMPCDVVLSGYHIPKGTEVVIGANLQLRNEKYVPRANEFLPERWLRTEDGGDSSLTGHIENPFLYVPFGFGPRSCAGKRIVNIEMEIIISRLVRNFNIEFHYPIDKAFTTKFINVPNIPLNFKFEEREV